MISISHLEKKFTEATPLKDINVEINKGDIISIIGPSGTGKSTLLRCINMLDPPTKGKIIINGQDVTDKKTNLHKIRHKMGMVFQSFNLYSHKMVVENVMMAPMDLFKVPKQEAFDEAVKYLKMVGLGERLYAYPDELSGGQKQRVAIARCLALKPEIILFDEPTSALDPTMVSEVQAVIRNLAEQGLTMMIVTHDMKFSREIANRVFYLDEGIVYEDGTPDEIFDNPKREKTRAFVKRLKTMEVEISSKDFDLYGMNSKIETFGKYNFMAQKQIQNIELVLEELVINNIFKSTDQISIGIRYYEVDKCTEIDLSYSGVEFNPFENSDNDDISMMIVNRYCGDVKHSYTDKNNLSFMLVNQSN